MVGDGRARDPPGRPLRREHRHVQLSRLELVDKINQELEENPALEEIQDILVKDSNEEKSESDTDTSEKEVTIEEKILDNIDWSNYIEEYNVPGKLSGESEEREAPRFDAFVSKKESLIDHLLWQLLMTFPSEEDQEIGSLIIGNLHKYGYL